jgi:hypothetical protein
MTAAAAWFFKWHCEVDMAGGSDSVKETSAEKAAAGVAKEQWDLYKNELSQYEDIFMDKVDGLNDESKYGKVAADANLAYSSSFTKARDNTATGLAAAGVDPTSGKYKSAMNNLTQDQAVAQIDTTNKAQTDQSNKFTAGLSDVVSIGAGQKAEALSGYSSIANNSLSEAVTDAQTSQSNSAATSGAVGTAAGMGLSYYMNMPSAASADSTKKAFTGSFG